MKRTLPLIGLVLIVGLASFATGQSTSNSRPVQEMRSNVQTGRYQIVFNPNVRADTFLLDTQTGQTWTSTHYEDLEAPSVWLHRERLDNNADEIRFIKEHNTKKQ